MDAPPPAQIEARVQQAGLRVLVTDESGLALPNAIVNVRGPALIAELEARTDQDGVTILAGLPNGRVEITVSHPAMNPQRSFAELQAGRRTHVSVSLHTSECSREILLLGYPLLPEEGRRGATVERRLLDVLPWDSLGGAAGILEHPALGTGERVPVRLLGLNVPDQAAGVAPRGLVSALDTRSVALLGPEGGDIELEDRWCDAPMAELSLAGSADGSAGGRATISGPLQGGHSGLSAGVDAGTLGEAAGLTLSARPGYTGRLWGLAFASPETWTVGARGELPDRDRLSTAFSGVLTGTDAGPVARVAWDTTLRSYAFSDSRLSTRVEGVGGSGRPAALLSTRGHLDVMRLDLRPEARVRLGADPGRLEAGLGVSHGFRDLEYFMHAGQRWEDLEALPADAVRTREALLGISYQPRSNYVLLQALGATRTDASGEPLPGRADLQLDLRGVRWGLEGLASYTWRPALDGYNVDLPTHEAGLLLGRHARLNRDFTLTAGLGLRGAWQDEALSGAGAARVGVARTIRGYPSELSLEGQLDPDTLRQVRLSWSVRALP